MRALQVPIATGELLRRVADVADAPRTVEDLGRSLARELVDGGDTPLWDAVGPALVEEREGGNLPLDAVVVARTAVPQTGQTARFLSSFYSGLAAAGVPVVGVETTDSLTTPSRRTATTASRRSTTSTRSPGASRSRCS